MNRKKKIIIKIISVFVTVLTLSLIIFYAFTFFGGGEKLIQDFQKWSSENMLLACGLYLLITPIVNIVPGISSMFFITIANMMLNDKTTPGMIQAFLLADVGMLLSTIVLFLIGRTAGKKVIGWVIGEEEYQKATYLLTIGGKASLPFVYLFPFFPDDAMSFVCGCTNMKFSYNLINAVIFRSVGVFSVCFIGRDFFDYSSFLWWHWVLVAVGILLCLFLLFLIVRAYYRYLRKKDEGPRYLLIMGLSTIVKKKEKDIIYGKSSHKIEKGNQNG